MQQAKFHSRLNTFFVLLFLPFLMYAMNLSGQPTVTSLSSLSGIATGGQSITIYGSGFSTGSPQVYFGALPSPSVTVINDTQLTATTPATVPGVVDITVVTSNGTSPVSQNDRFAFTGDWIAFLPDFSNSQVYPSYTTTNLLMNPIPVGSTPNDVAVSFDGTTAYCVNSSSNDISVINVASSTVTATIPVTGQSFPIFMALTEDLTFSPPHNIAYVCNYESGTVSQVDLVTGGTTTVNLGANSFPVGGIVTAYNSGLQAICYVVNSGSSNIARVDFTQTPPAVTSIDTGAGSSPSFIVLAPDGTTAYFTDNTPDASGNYYVRVLLNVNTSNPTLGNSITDPSFNFNGYFLFPQIAIAPPQIGTGDIYAYVTNTGDPTTATAVTVLNVTSPTNPTVGCVLSAGIGPNGMAVTPDGSKLYVCNAVQSSYISIITGLPVSPPSCSPLTFSQSIPNSTFTDPSITPDQAPLAYFVVNPNPAVINQSVTFDASASISPFTSIYSYTWDFGDGSSPITVYTPTTSYTYTTANASGYPVTLTVTNSAGTSTFSSTYFNGQFMLRNGLDIPSGPSAQYTLPVIVTSTGNPSSTSLTSTPNPSNYGASVDFTATVTGNAGSAPTGTVNFYANGSMTPFATGNLTPQPDSTTTSTTSISTSTLPGGYNNILAVYSPDNSSPYTGSSGSDTQQVIPASTQTIIISNLPNPSFYGNAVTFIAHVLSAVSPNTLSGVVQFYDATDPNNLVLIGVGTLDPVTLDASTTYSGLSVGTHSIEAVFIPGTSDPNHSGSTSSTVIQTVSSATTSTMVQSSANPSTYGQLVTFTATVTITSGGTGSVSNDFVSFYNGPIFLGQALIENGGNQAFFDVSNLSVGSHNIIAIFNDPAQPATVDPNFVSSQDNLTQMVNQANTTTMITGSSRDPSVVGEAVTFTAHVAVVAPGSGILTGTVQFLADGIDIGSPVSLDGSGNATSPSTSSLTLGAHIITAAYSEDPNFIGSTSPNFTQTVAQANTTTMITGSSRDPSVVGEAVTFTAHVAVVAPGSGILTGTVQFLADGIDIGSPVSLDGSGNATSPSISSLTLGAHIITAAYSEDPNFIGSTSPNFTQTVAQANTTTMITGSSRDPSVVGEAVTFTAHVAVVAPGSGILTGTVQFLADGIDIGSPVSLDGSGNATSPSISSLTLGAHIITAAYSEDPNFIGSTSPNFTQTVAQANTTTMITGSSRDPSVVGEAVTFTAHVAVVAPGSGILTGTVQFLADGIDIGSPVSLDGSGNATSPSISSLTLGAHIITAAYSEDPNFIGSTSPNFTQTVAQANTTTMITGSSRDPSVVGEAVTFTAHVAVVAPGSGILTGTVQFLADGIDIGSPVSLDGSGNATSPSTSSLTLGAHIITAAYSEDPNFIGSTSPNFTQTVAQANTTTMITGSSRDPSVVGEAVTFTAHVAVVAPGSGILTGTVQFLADGIDIGSPVSLDGSGNATSPSTSSLTLGAHIITAAYSEDPNFIGSTSLNFTQTVAQANTTTMITGSSRDPSVVGEVVTFTAHVAVVAPGSGILTGTVQFLADGIDIGSPVSLDGSGNATSPSISSLTLGAHIITAAYSEDPNFIGSTSPNFTQTINPDQTSTSIISSLNPSQLGDLVYFTATVVPQTSTSGQMTGSVQFMMNGNLFGSSQSLINGQASISTSTLLVGSSEMTAIYGGNDTHYGSLSPNYIQNVQGATITAITASPPSSVFGQPVTFSATVISPTGGPTPTGIVQFFDGSTFLGNGTLNSIGVASLTTSSLAVGTHPTIFALYTGDVDHLGSPSIPISYTVNPDSTTITVTSSPNPSTIGQTVTFTAQVAANTPGSGTPTGYATFSIDGGTGIVVPVVNGIATLSTSNLSVGSHLISVTYGGDSNFTGSTGSVDTLVNQAGTTTSVSSSQNPSVIGQSVTFTATVNSTPGLAISTGTVTFIIDGVQVSVVNLVNGQASFQTSALSGGQHTIVAVYSGDANHQASTSLPFIETIIAVLPPRDLKVCQVENRFVSQTDRINIITWKAPRIGDSPVSYRIYRDPQLKEKIATVHMHYSSSHERFRYEDHNRKKHHTYTYYIVSVDEFGNVSAPVRVIYKGERSES